MKKFLIVIAVLMAGAMVCGTANAALLGIKAAYEGLWPDIDFNNDGVITYDADSNLFTLSAVDNKIRLADGTKYSLSVFTGDPNIDFTTSLTLRIYVDESGNMTGGYDGYDMIEEVTVGSLAIDGVAYNTGAVLLQADVSQFGWGAGTGGVPSFDFLLDTASGGLVNQSIWPSPSPGTALWVETNSATWGWDADFGPLTNAKGDKMVTPEPTSMLLLGIGLIGLAGRVRKRFKA